MDDVHGGRSLYEDIFRSTQKLEKTGVENGKILDIRAMDSAARLIHQSLDLASAIIKPGLTTRELAEEISRFLSARGADPGSIIRISPEEVVWHGLPNSRVIEFGEIVSVDIACSVRQWWADGAKTIPVGQINSIKSDLIQTAIEGMKTVIRGMKSGDDGLASAEAIRKLCGRRSVTLVTEAAGHGIGRRLHETPSITYDGRPHTPLKLNSVYTVEPIFTSGDGNVRMTEDGSAETNDGEPSAHFEVTVLLVEHGVHILGAPDWMSRQPC
ncbi:MAG: M24 family metallopeptidase [Spirochaetaceae bacterium]|nr:M24 family metallopeptidase [Spirochaetaceae bacterium]